MGKHILSVDIIPTNNDQVMHLFDTSFYAEGLTVTCSRLEIYVPGFNTPRLLEPVKDFNLSINATTLDLVSPELGYLPALPDGVYTIKYSVSPNEYVFTVFNHFRVTTFQKELLKERCALNLNVCAPSEDVVESLKKIQEIENYLLAAVASVEVCNEDPDKGIILFSYAKKLFNRYKKTC